jgi:tetratricopeptide (TPR) repeat protein
VEARAWDAREVMFRVRNMPDAAEPMHERATALARETGNRRIEAEALMNTGHVANLRADYVAAERAYMDALILIDGTDDVQVEAAALANLGEVAGRMGCTADASGYNERALALAGEASAEFERAGNTS